MHEGYMPCYLRIGPKEGIYLLKQPSHQQSACDALKYCPSRQLSRFFNKANMYLCTLTGLDPGVSPSVCHVAL